jgi:hypothetical protein
MFGIDDHIASMGDGTIFAVVAAVAILLGLRHATDPDHLTAVTTLLAGDRRDARGAGRLGLAWGLGHATTLFVFGLPVVLFESYLPESLQIGAEVAVGVLIVGLGARLLIRWRRGRLGPGHGTPRAARGAYGIGLVHGMGGTAGVGVLLLASIPSHAEAVVAMALFAAFTAVSMAAASTTFGVVLTRDAVVRRYVTMAPALGALSLAFGAWYALGALDAVPYAF